MIKKTLSIVIAAYNEAPIIAQNIKRVIQELDTHPEVDWEIVCVNDGSRDRTGLLMEEAASGNERVCIYHHSRNFGQGRALRTAFRHCGGDVVVTLDADLSYGPEYIFPLIEALERERVDIALASPYTAGGAVSNVPFYRHFLSRMGNRYLASTSSYQISTSTCVVRAYRREVIDDLILTSDGMELQLEILMKAAMMNFRVCEVPAHLEWADDKLAEADLKRVSKMKILRTIRLYLTMGWLSRPAGALFIVSWLLLLPGGYMALRLLMRMLDAVYVRFDVGPLEAISSGLQDTFSQYTYSVAFCALFLLVGMQMLSFSLILVQNKLNFEEMCRMLQQHHIEAKSPGYPQSDFKANGG